MHGSWSSSLAALIFDDMCVKKSDHRHRRLLRACRERPCGRSAAEECNELASPHGAYPKARDHGPSIAARPVHRSKSGPLMTASGLGCVKTPALAADVETFWRNCISESRRYCTVLGSMP